MSETKAPPPTVLVTDIMVKDVHKVTLNMTLLQVAEMMTKHLISGAPVVDAMERVVSVIGEGDTLRLMAAHGIEATVNSCLPKLLQTKDLVTLQKFATFADAYRLFMKHKFHRIPIVDGGGNLKGLVTRSMILKIIVEGHHGKRIDRSA